MKKLISSVFLVFFLTLSAAATAGVCNSVIFADDFESGETLTWQGHAAMNEDFESNLGDWNFLNIPDAFLTLAFGELTIEPMANTLWFNDSTSIFLNKRISGNFKATSYVTAQRRNQNVPPEIQFRLGGLMARNPDTVNGENYVFLVVGADANDVSVEHKTTVNSVSTFDGPSWPSGEGEIRLCRVDCEFRLYIRESMGSWQLQATYDRPDLPPIVQVGPLAYANASPADLQVSFDRVDYEEVFSVADCLN